MTCDVLRQRIAEKSACIRSAAIPAALLAVLLSASLLRADPPATLYIFPAGGQRGTEVKFRVGGLYLHESCPFEMSGKGVEATPRLEKTETIWFEGPVIPLPDSQAQEDYPQDMAGSVKIAADAPNGPRPWRVWTDQGAVSARPFIVGDLPEVVEEEIDGDPIPVKISLPVTVNGRIFPREDVDIWSFDAKAGQTITCTVLAARLGSPLEARLEVRDSRGKRLAESSEAAAPGVDALVQFTPPADGVYSVGIHDLKFGGLQHYVYRLSITAGPFVTRVYPLGARRGTTGRFELSGVNLPASPVEIPLPADGAVKFMARLPSADNSANPFTLDLDDLPEALEREPNNDSAHAQPVESPAVVNGRIERAGDVDYWSFQAAKGGVFEFDLRAARLGSPLDSVLVLVDKAGKELGRSDDAGGAALTDSFLRFTFPEEGAYFARVEERLASRGGEAFAYRLRIAPPPAPDFRLHLAADSLSVNRAGEAKLKVRVERLGAAGEVKLEFDGLPQGVTVVNPVVPANAAEADIAFKAEAAAPAAARAVRIRGTTMIGDKPVSRQADFVSAAIPDLEVDSLLLAVCVPTPFKLKGVYEVKYAQRGGKFVRHFTIDRSGYNGPLKVRLADKQARHLQGVRGSTIEVPAGVSEFDYAVFLPPWMEIGRTSRSVVMAVGEVEDPDGSRHKVSFTSINQNEQIVALVDPGQLTVDIDRQTVVGVPGESVALSIQVGRGQSVAVPVRVELIVPTHIRGVSAEPMTVAVDQSACNLTIKFAADRPGPFNMPLLIRATAMKGENDPVVAETKVEIVER